MASPLNITKIPAPRVPVIDASTGLISREWYRFFLNLFDLTGAGTNPTTLEDIQQGPPTLTIDEVTAIITRKTLSDLAPTYELGTISPQNSDNVSITGGNIDGTPIGDTTTSSGKFTTLNATGGIGGGNF
jgi:hypothetical protein